MAEEEGRDRVGQALAGAALGFASGASGQNFLGPYLETLGNRRKRSKRLGANHDILTGQVAGNESLKEYWDAQLTDVTNDDGSPLTIQQKIEIVAGYEPAEFGAVHDGAIRFMADKGRDSKDAEERARNNSMALSEMRSTFLAAGQELPQPREGQSEESYIGELRGIHNARNIGYAQASAALDEHQEERAAFLSDLNALEAEDWMKPETAQMFLNRAQTLEGRAKTDLGPYFPGIAAGFSAPMLAAVERKSEDARLTTLARRVEQGDFTNVELPPVFADGARKNGQTAEYSEEDFRRVGIGAVFQKIAPTYDAVRQMVGEGVEATPELADARQYIITNELSGKAFNNLPAEQKRELAELLNKVPANAVPVAKQLHQNKISRDANEGRMASALVAAGVADPKAMAGIVGDEKNFIIDHGEPDGQLPVRTYGGLSPEGVEKLAQVMPESIRLSTEATAWANRVAQAGSLTPDQRETLIGRAVGTAIGRRDRGSLVSMERDLERPPDIAVQRQVIGEIVSLAGDEQPTLPFNAAFAALSQFAKPPGRYVDINPATGIPRSSYKVTPSSEAARREWIQNVVANEAQIRAQVEAIPEVKGDRARRAKALEALDTIVGSPESMIVRKSGAPDLRGPSERLIESVVSGLDQDAINVRQKEIAKGIAEAQATLKSGLVDEQEITEELATLQIEQEEITLMQQAGLSGETRRGVLVSLVRGVGDPDADWEKMIQDMGARFGGFDTTSGLPAWAGEATEALKAAKTPTERLVAVRELASKNPDLFYKASAVPSSGQAGLLVGRAFVGDLNEMQAAAADLAESGVVTSKAQLEGKFGISLPADFDKHGKEDQALMLIAAGLSARPLTGKPRPAAAESQRGSL